MNERLKELRKALGYTQREFANRISTAQNTFSKWESGVNCPNDASISLICREFGVSEAWLRTGEGEMFAPETLSEELAAFGGLLAGGGGTYAQRVFATVLARLPSELTDAFLKSVLDTAREIAEKENEPNQ